MYHSSSSQAVIPGKLGRETRGLGGKSGRIVVELIKIFIKTRVLCFISHMMLYICKHFVCPLLVLHCDYLNGVTDLLGQTDMTY